MSYYISLFLKEGRKDERKGAKTVMEKERKIGKMCVLGGRCDTESSCSLITNLLQQS